MKEDVTAEIDFSLSDELTAEKEFTSEDIQTISLFDEVFKVEDDYEAYQIAQSVPRRAVLAKEYLDCAIMSAGEGNVAEVNLLMLQMKYIFSTEFPLGVSVGKYTASKKLPIFDINAVKAVHPDIADEVESLISDLNYFYDGVHNNNLTVNEMNDRYESVSNTTAAIKEFYHIS